MYYNNYNNYTYPNYSQSNNDTNLIFVNGLEGARGYRIRPQQTVLLVDSTQSRIYLKSTDNLGIETMKTYSIAEVENKETTDIETRLDKIETNLNKIMETITGNKGDKQHESNNAVNESKQSRQSKQ